MHGYFRERYITFAVAFQTRRRRDDFHHNLGSGVLRLPMGEGFILNYPFGKLLRYGRVQPVPILPESDVPVICPVAAIQQYVEAVRTYQWDMGRR